MLPKGPVIGPLVICLAVCKQESEQQLRSIGVKDSKLLSPEKREELAPEVKGICDVHVVKITAKEINKFMREGVSLNDVEAMYLADLIKEIDKKKLSQIEKIVLDSPDPEAVRFSHRVQKYLPATVDVKGKLYSSHKADVLFPIVSAASIIAKTVRDAEIEKIKKELGCNFGTGYSHDAATIKCMEENIDNPILKKYLRTEWATTKNMIARLKYKTKQVRLDL